MNGMVLREIFILLVGNLDFLMMKNAVAEIMKSLGRLLAV